MKFEVTVCRYEGKEEVAERFQIEAKELNIVRDNLREAYYKGEINSFEIKPVVGGAG